MSRHIIAAEQEASAPEEPEVEKGKFTKFLESTPLKQSDVEKAEKAQYKEEEKRREEREKAEAEKNKKPRFAFLRNVRSEMKRELTWPDSLGHHAVESGCRGRRCSLPRSSWSLR